MTVADLPLTRAAAGAARPWTACAHRAATPSRLVGAPLDAVYVVGIVCAIVLGAGLQVLLAAPLAAGLGARMWARRR